MSCWSVTGHPVGRLYHDVEKVETIGYRCLAHVLLTVPWLRRSLCTCLLPAWPVRYINIFLVLSRYQCSVFYSIITSKHVAYFRCDNPTAWRPDVPRRPCGFSTRYRGSVTPINYLSNPIRFREERLSRKVDGFDSCFDIYIQPTYSRSKIHEGPISLDVSFINERNVSFERADYANRVIDVLPGGFITLTWIFERWRQQFTTDSCYF